MQENTAQKEPRTWWKEAVIYQIYPRSFMDANGDGIGDLAGITSRLPYLRELGVDVLWLSPVYASPNDDNGYDIKDYRAIMEDFGTMADFDALLAAAHRMGLKIVMDLVVNHSSDECVWFKEACKSRDNPYHDYYIWRDPKYDKKGNRLPPNNWISLFEGGAWKYVESVDQYYLHVFAEKQPDLNHDNPKVREEVKNIMRFWLDMGVDGFREDVITFISKREGLPNGFPLPIAAGIEHYNKGPNLMKYLHEYRAVADEYDCIQVAESPMTGAKDAVNFTVGDDKVFDMMITFDHMNADCFMTDTIHLPFSLRKLKKGHHPPPLLAPQAQEGALLLAGEPERPGLELPLHREPRPSPRHLPLRLREVLEGERQSPCHLRLHAAGHALRLPGPGTRHAEQQTRAP